VVNGPGEALVSDLGLAGSANKSAFYDWGQRVDRLDNKDLIPTLERRIRDRAAMLDPANRIPMEKE
ncbi:4-hydroxy-3-methylbut-2-en-1-yl diphosphate synthase, partial [Aeromonas veronii]